MVDWAYKKSSINVEHCLYQSAASRAMACVDVEHCLYARSMACVDVEHCLYARSMACVDVEHCLYARSMACVDVEHCLYARSMACVDIEHCLYARSMACVDVEHCLYARSMACVDIEHCLYARSMACVDVEHCLYARSRPLGFQQTTQMSIDILLICIEPNSNKLWNMSLLCEPQLHTEMIINYWMKLFWRVPSYTWLYKWYCMAIISNIKGNSNILPCLFISW